MPVTYDLQCSNGHIEESRFRDSDTYYRLREAGHLMCSRCGSSEITKRLPAPALVGMSNTKTSARQNPRDQLAALLASAKDVGDQFADMIHAMADGKIPQQNIRGNATAKEAFELAERGAPIIALPKQKLNS